jgi:hypothetical protein
VTLNLCDTMVEFDLKIHARHTSHPNKSGMGHLAHQAMSRDIKECHDKEGSSRWSGDNSSMPRPPAMATGRSHANHMTTTIHATTPPDPLGPYSSLPF